MERKLEASAKAARYGSSWHNRAVWLSEKSSASQSSSELDNRIRQPLPVYRRSSTANNPSKPLMLFRKRDLNRLLDALLKHS